MKIKIITGLFVVLLLLGLTVFFLFIKIQKTQHKKEVYQSIPTFQISDINGQIVTEAFLQDSRIVMFVYFNPDCDLCRDEIIQIKENESALSQGKIIFFSESYSDSIQQFLRTIDFKPPSNMLFLSDEKALLIRKMNVMTNPTIYIYRQGQLIKRFNGPAKTETLIHYITEQ